MDWFQNYFTELVEAMVDPRKRVSVGYLGSAILIALGWSLLRKRQPIQGLRRVCQTLFSRKIWLSASALADYQLFMANRAVMMIIAPWLISRLAMTTALFFWLHELSSRPTFAHEVPAWFVTIAFTVTLFLLDDSTRYLLHRLLHRVPLLWAFHKVHHSAETLTPFTVYRTHPLEGVVFSIQRTVVQALVIAVFVFIFSDKVSLLSILGANVFLFTFNLLGANLRHSHIPISYGRRVERVLISPLQHQLHHSRAVEHHDCNFGAVLAVWDNWWGTLRVARDEGDLQFGLSSNRTQHGLATMYVTPFLEVFHSIFNAWREHSKNSFLRRKFCSGNVLKGSMHWGLRVSMIVAVFFLSASLSRAVQGETLNIYSHRQPFLIEPFIEAFKAQTGIEVNVVYSSKGLAQRLQAEGKRSPADVVLTVDIGRLYVYADKDLLVPVSSEILDKNIPAHLKDPANRWFGVSKRARVVAIAKDRVDSSEIERLEDLSSPIWKGRICSRPGSHVYNRALLSSLIAANGKQAAEQWAAGLVENLAQRPQGADRAQVKAIYQGVCDIALINNYYYGKLRSSDVPEHREWADAIELVFTNQQDRGNHINISGVGVAKYSKNKENALKFIEFLSEPSAQQLYSEVNFEYPVNPAVEMSPELASWGRFREDNLPIEQIALLGPEAQRIIDRVGW